MDLIPQDSFGVPKLALPNELDKLEIRIVYNLTVSGWDKLSCPKHKLKYRRAFISVKKTKPFLITF